MFHRAVVARQQPVGGAGKFVLAKARAARNLPQLRQLGVNLALLEVLEPLELLPVRQLLGRLALLARLPRFTKAGLTMPARRIATLQGLLVVRGNDRRPTEAELMPSLHKHLAPVAWNRRPFTVRSAPGRKPMLTMAAVRSSTAELLSDVRHKAGIMFDYGAYTHWYSRYGADEAIFRDAFETIDGIVAAYDGLTV